MNMECTLQNVCRRNHASTLMPLKHGVHGVILPHQQSCSCLSLQMCEYPAREILGGRLSCALQVEGQQRVHVAMVLELR